MFISWLKIQEQNVLSKPQVKNDNTWYNPKITVGNKSIFFKSFAHLRFIFVGDLLNINVTFISFEKLKQINPATKFLEFAYLRNSCKDHFVFTIFLHTKFNIQEYKPVIPINIYFSKNE